MQRLHDALLMLLYSPGNIADVFLTLSLSLCLSLSTELKIKLGAFRSLHWLSEQRLMAYTRRGRVGTAGKVSEMAKILKL